MKSSVVHFKCGKTIAYLLNGATLSNMGSADFERLDGTHPRYGDVFRERCPYCNTKILTPRDWYTECSLVYVQKTNKSK